MNALLDGERAEMARCEAVIERGLQTFTEVGNALLRIRDGRLYRAEHATFEAYCRERWGFTDRRARMLMSAAQTVALIETGTIVPVLPATESQARPLTRLRPERQGEAWQRAVETAPNGKVTAAHVQRVVEEEFMPRPAAKMAIHYSSKTPEWYTPANIIERTIRLMGAIDLDPCSNSHDDPNIPAAAHLTCADDGLRYPWPGRIYMNPPYGREIADWVEHLYQEYEGGRTVEAVALLPSRTDTQWFRRLRMYPRCFLWGRLKFSGNETAAPFPSVVVYLGDNVSDFREAFGEIGDTYILAR